MTVYVVQDQRRYDKDTGKYVNKFNLTSAEEHGELKYLLTPTASPFHPETLMPELWDRLKDFSDADALLLIGNPILIGWATAIAADANNGHVTLLQWHGRDRKYIPVTAQVFDVDGQAD